MIVPITRIDLGAAEQAAVARVLASGWIMQGPEVAAFETEFAAFVAAPHAVAVANGTVALELALRALRIGPGDEVITVSHSFIATANSVVNVGARPVFVDVEADTFGMDPARVAAAITPRTRAVLCVHQLGFPVDVAAIQAAAGDLPIIEDAACAAGSEILRDGTWERIGKPHGRLATFSFHPRKLLTTGEGGMVTTADPDLAARVRRLRQHGAEGEHFVEPASNHRLTDLAAAIGRVQLVRLPAAIAERRARAERYAAALDGHPVLRGPKERPTARTNWQSYPCLVQDQAAVMRRFSEAGVSTRGGLTNAHLEPAHPTPVSLPVSETLQTTTVMLPLFHGMTTDEERAVLQVVADLRQV